MTARKDKIVRAMQELDNDKQKSSPFTLQQLANKAHEAVEPEIKELQSQIDALKKDADATLQTRVKTLEDEAEANEKEHADIKAKSDAINSALADFLTELGAAGDFNDIATAARNFADAVSEHHEELATTATKTAETLESE